MKVRITEIEDYFRETRGVQVGDIYPVEHISTFLRKEQMMKAYLIKLPNGKSLTMYADQVELLSDSYVEDFLKELDDEEK